MGSETLRASDGAVVIVAGSAAGASQQTDASGAELYARFFRALGDPTRVRLLRLLLDAPAGECGVGELIEALGVPQSRVSTHLGCLRWCGLVQARRDGKQVYYRVADPRVRELLALSGTVIRDHAAGVASCGMVG
ncbi:MAG: metalloregulator ArsR/SmtB family transcription factor [Ktedonobacterales bacterium]